MAFKNIYDELNRRNVIRAVITYVAVSWVILQAASIIFPALEFNQKAMKFLIVLLLIGFIPWVVFAWFYEYTGSGFRKTEEIPLDESITQSTGKRMNAIIIASLSLAVILLLADRKFNFTNNMAVQYNEKSIAVLPFENLSPDDDSYFTRGIAEDILTQISKIEDLKVLSRFTLREYDTKGKTPRIIAEDLKVANLLSGSVRRSGDQLRIGCQLINPLDGSEVWAETFDRPLQNIFAVQSEVAEKVAFYLKSELSESSNIEINFAPTENMIAYNHYLKGRDLFHSYNAGDNEKSIESYKLALQEDPNFALAMAALSGSYSKAVQIFSTRPYNYLDTAFVLAERSTLLLPESSRTWHSLGLVYDQKGLYEDAKRMYLTALDKNPNNEGSISNLALILKDEGEHVESINLQKKSIEINPLNSLSYLGLAADYRRLEMYDEALTTLEKASALDVNNWVTDYYLAYTHICAGNYENARPNIEKILAMDSTNLRYLEIAGELYSYFDPVLSKKNYEKVLESPSFDPRINFFAGVGIGHFLWEEGKIDSANVYLDDVFVKHQKLMQEGSEDLNSIMILASIHGIRHENAEAISYLEKVPRAALDYVSWVRSPMSRSLQDDPRFIDLIKKEKRSLEGMRNELLQQQRKGPKLKG